MSDDAPLPPVRDEEADLLAAKRYWIMQATRIGALVVTITGVIIMARDAPMKDMKARCWSHWALFCSFSCRAPFRAGGKADLETLLYASRYYRA